MIDRLRAGPALSCGANRDCAVEAEQLACTVVRRVADELPQPRAPGTVLVHVVTVVNSNFVVLPDDPYFYNSYQNIQINL